MATTNHSPIATIPAQNNELPPCNGWLNKPTWLVNLWLNNDEGLYHQARAIAAEGTEALQAFVEGFALGDSPDASLATDLLTWALTHVDWDGVHESLTAD